MEGSPPLNRGSTRADLQRSGWRFEDRDRLKMYVKGSTIMCADSFSVVGSKPSGPADFLVSFSLRALSTVYEGLGSKSNSSLTKEAGKLHWCGEETQLCETSSG